jgi:uncharacterized membrane protein (DUF373 family)
VILVALPAVARKFIIIDFTAEPLAVLALGWAALALGLVYWLVREQDRREEAHETNSSDAR